MGDKWSRGGREVVEPHTGIIISHIQNGNLSLFSQGVLFIYSVGKCLSWATCSNLTPYNRTCVINKVNTCVFHSKRKH